MYRMLFVITLIFLFNQARASPDCSATTQLNNLNPNYFASSYWKDNDGNDYTNINYVDSLASYTNIQGNDCDPSPNNQLVAPLGAAGYATLNKCPNTIPQMGIQTTIKAIDYIWWQVCFAAQPTLDPSTHCLSSPNCAPTPPATVNDIDPQLGMVFKLGCDVTQVLLLSGQDVDSGTCTPLDLTVYFSDHPGKYWKRGKLTKIYPRGFTNNNNLNYCSPDQSVTSSPQTGTILDDFKAKGIVTRWIAPANEVFEDTINFNQDKCTNSISSGTGNKPWKYIAVVPSYDGLECGDNQLKCANLVKQVYLDAIVGLNDDCDLATCGSVSGDPQFVGFNGIHFQVHGLPDRIFNIITTRNFQFNALFSYIESLDHHSHNHSLIHTVPFTHPGTYFSDVGIQFSHNQLRLTAGIYDQGFETCTFNNFTLKVGQKIAIDSYIVYRKSSHVVIVKTQMFDFTIVNSEKFFNFENIQLYRNEVYDVSLINGLLGATVDPQFKKIDQIYDYLIDGE
jgi:hypothetical protein